MSIVTILAMTFIASVRQVSIVDGVACLSTYILIGTWHNKQFCELAAHITEIVSNVRFDRKIYFLA